MRKYPFILLLLLCMAAHGQDYDSVRLSQLPKLTLPPHLKSGGLPYKVDNSRTIHFPPIFTQYGYSCNQAASIAIGFTYELNAMRGLDARYDQNRLPAFFEWNMMNSGKFDVGVSYFESWDMVDALGCPNWSDYGGWYINESRWLNGYYRYYRGMLNRVEMVYSIDVSTEQGLLTLKHWLYDHLGEYRPGGVANFQLATLDLQFRNLPPGTEDAGHKMIPFFNYAVGHAMTFVGYNDSVRYDFNNDGKYTNNLDINDDGVVDMRDREIGALICVNTYGNEWGTEGRAYVPYRILPLTPEEGGIWQKSVVVAKPRREYQPLLTLRATVRYPDRSKLWITAGASQDPDATAPDHILDQPVFHYQGGPFPMQGNGPDEPELIEIGIDATPLLTRLRSGEPASFFLVVCEQDPDSASEGSIENFSFSEYFSGEKEHPGVSTGMAIKQAYDTRRVVFSPVFSAPVITSSHLPPATAGQEYQARLTGMGGTPPYKWSLADPCWDEEPFAEPFPSTLETRVLPDGANFDRKTISLPFGFLYRGKVYREATITATGGILFEENLLYIPYGIALREMLGLNRAIYPFYSAQYAFTEYLDGAFCELRHDYALIRWKAAMYPGGQRADVNFAARLNIDGSIEFLYGDFSNHTTIPWLVGLTGGTRTESFYPTVNATGIRSGFNIRFKPRELPPGLRITPDGELTCFPGQPGNWKIPVRIGDSRGLTTFADLELSAGSTGIRSGDEAAERVKIWPNPVTDRLFLEVECPREGNIILSVYDFTGREILQRTTFVNAGKSLLTLDAIDENGSGIYVVQVSGAVSYRSKFYIQQKINSR